MILAVFLSNLFVDRVVQQIFEVSRIVAKFLVRGGLLVSDFLEAAKPIGKALLSEEVSLRGPSKTRLIICVGSRFKSELW